MNPTETLTIRIVADTSQFDRALSNITTRLQELQTRLHAVAALQPAVAQLAQRFDDLQRPLAAVSNSVQLVTRQIQLLAQTPVLLNVAPALQALAAVAQAIQAVAAQARSLTIPAPVPAPVPMLPGYAAGGLVAGPPGVDRVPAFLSAGEFVLRADAVRQLGASFLATLNQPRPAPTPRPAFESDPPRSITNHVGGINLHVRTPTDARSLLRDLHRDTTLLRNRRG